MLGTAAALLDVLDCTADGAPIVEGVEADAFDLLPEDFEPSGDAQRLAHDARSSGSMTRRADGQRDL